MSGRADWRLPALVALALFALYAATAPRTVVLEDDGLFLMAAYANGVAHPPGYPLYTLLAHAASLLPGGSVALRVHLLSGLLAALACAVLAVAGRQLGLGRAAAALAAAALGVSPVFWSQAIIAEVYALNALLMFALLALALRWRQAAGAPAAPRGLPWAAGLLAGLALANHWPLALLMAPGLALLLAPVARPVLRAAPAVAAGLLLGLLPYAWMVLRSQQLPEISYHGPIESLADFWRIVSRADYSDVDHSPSAGWRDTVGLAGFALAELARQFGPVGAALTALGLAGRWRAWRRHPDSVEPALLLAFLGPTLLLVLLLDFDDEPFQRAVFRVYPMAAYGIAALWLASGAQGAARWTVARRPGLRRAAPAALAALVLGLAALPGAPGNVRAGEAWAERYGAALLEALPPDAVLLADGDTVAGPAGYLHVVEGLRPDVTITSSWGVVFSDRLFRADRLTRAQQREVVRAYVAQERRPLYYVRPVEHGFAVEELGFLRRADRSGTPALQRYAISRRLLAYADWLLRQPPPRETWTRVHRAMLFDELVRWLVWLDRLDPAPPPALLQWRERALAVTRTTLHGCLGEAEARLGRFGTDALPDVHALLDRAEALAPQALTKRDRAAIALLRGDALRRAGDRAGAAAAFREALARWPHPENRAAAALAQLPAPELP